MITQRLCVSMMQRWQWEKQWNTSTDYRISWAGTSFHKNWATIIFTGVIFRVVARMCVLLFQSRLITKILQQTNMYSSKQVHSPMFIPSKIYSGNDDKQEVYETYLYQIVVGKFFILDCENLSRPMRWGKYAGLACRKLMRRPLDCRQKGNAIPRSSEKRCLGDCAKD